MLVDGNLLIEKIDLDELMVEVPPLIALEHGCVDSIDGVAQFMYRGGPSPPQASVQRRSSGQDHRPEKKYWDFVKEEMGVFLCENAERYRELWGQIMALKDKSTGALVGLLAAFFAQIVGVPSALLAGFVAVCLYAIGKFGKEAYCHYLKEHRTKQN